MAVSVPSVPQGARRRRLQPHRARRAHRSERLSPMRTGTTLSVVAHGGVLAWGLVSLAVRPLDATQVEAIPIAIVSLADVTSLPKADRPPPVDAKPAPAPPAPPPAALADAPPTPPPPPTAAVAD